MYRSAGRSAVAAAVLAAALGGIPVADAAPLVGAGGGRCPSCGTVVDVDPIFARGRSVGGGAVLGAIVGSAVGSRIGSGDTATTVAGAAAGVAMGHNAASRGSAVSGYTITIEMDGGVVRTLEAADDYDLDRGDRVRVTHGRLSRL